LQNRQPSLDEFLLMPYSGLVRGVARSTFKEITELLLAHKANVNAVDNRGWTPMARAQKRAHPEIAALLQQQHGGHE
jgi:hypothetical protein